MTQSGWPAPRGSWLLAAIAVVAFEVFLVIQPLDHVAMAAVVDLLLGIAAAVAGVACWRRSRRERRRQRRGWELLSASCAVLALGQLVFTAQVIVERLTPGSGTTPADLLLVLVVPLAALGLVYLAGRSLTNRLVTALDALVIALSWLLVGWVLFLGPVYRTPGSQAEKIATLVYIGGGLALTALVLILAARWSGDGITLLFLGVAFAWVSVASAAYGVERVRGTYRTGDPWIDVGFLAPLLLVALAAARPRVPEWNGDVHRRELLTLFVPYFALLLATVTIFALLLSGGEFDDFLEVCGATVLVIVLGRQAVTLLELDSLNRGLESRVEERSAEVRSSEERMSALLRNSSDVIATVEHKGTFTYVSPAADVVLGYEGEELVGHHVLDLVHPGDRAVVAQVLEAVSQGRLATATLSGRVAHRDGRWRSVEATASPQDVEGGSVVLNIRDVSERVAMEGEMLRQASYDTLTALANRRLLNERLRHALDRASRSGEAVSLLFVDLDHFKRINDTAGHAVGDQVLVQVADRLRLCLRPADTAARLGGDEFAVLLEDTDAVQAQEVADRVVATLEPLFHLPDRSLPVTASVGVTTCLAGASTSDGLLREADIAMYQAKAQGRGQAAVFHADMNSALIEQMELEAGLRRAIEENRLRLEYQPLIDLKTRTITGVEALLRWAGEHDNDIPPALFIPLAEECGLIQRLDRWVLAQACHQVREWQQAYPEYSSLRVNVNLSSLELREPAIVQQIADILDLSGLEPRYLMLEITETAMLPDAAEAADVLSRTRALGVGVSLDDFGVGNSSLAMLGQLPVDEVKIDQSFIAAIDSGPNARRLLRAIIEMAQALDLDTVAEAVETPNQLAWLRRLDCSSGQGYLFSPPLSEADMGRVFELGLQTLEPRRTNGVKKAAEANQVAGDAAR